MTEKELAFFKNRIAELYDSCYQRNIPTHSHFLNVDEQAVLQTIHLSAGDICVRYSGGFDDAERRIVCFLPDYLEEVPEDIFAYLRIVPAAPKFAEPLSHRDFLGALINLGVRREMLGDIIISENTAHIVVLSEIAEHICDSLSAVRHSAVRVEREGREAHTASVHTEQMDVNTASLRVDSLVSAVWHISRTQSKELLKAGRISVNSALCADGSQILKAGQILSVRGKGRFRLLPGERMTRSGRRYVSIELFI